MSVTDMCGHPIYRQEPSRADKRHFYAFFRLKYYSLDHINALYIQISHMIAFATPPKQ